MSKKKLLLINSLAACALLIISAGLIFTYFAVKSMGELPEITQPQTSRFFYSNGELMTARFVENRSKVALEEVAEEAIWATIAAEDRRFEEHSGFDIKGIIRAAYRNLQERSVVQGGSSITQQLAKNLYLEQDRTWERKIEEAILTLQLERNYSKEEIMEKYLNTVFYGHGTYGIEAASELYFDKPASRLYLQEAALLAGLTRSPSHYSPLVNQEIAEKRAHAVLRTMVEEDFISKKEKEKALQQELELNPNPSLPRENNYVVDHLVHHKLNCLQEEEENLLKNGGLEIHTTIDPEMQEIAKKVLENNLPDLDRDHRGVAQPQGALVAMDPETGHIKALAGGKDYRETMLNRAYSLRSPGSAFKPVVYAAALENGYTAASTFKCEPVSLPSNGGDYQPTDFGGGYHHEHLTLRKALVQSCNVTAVKLNQEMGVENSIEMAEELGITSHLGKNLSLPLGTSEVKLVEMTASFAPFANGGYRVEPFLYKKAHGPGGEVLSENQPEKNKVLDKRVAYILTDIMKGVLSEEGTAPVSHLIDRPAAGKTGTSQDYKDAYMVGYTPDLVVGVYVGDDHGDPIWKTGGEIAAPIWAEFTERALQDTPASSFSKPPGLVDKTICPETGKIQHPLCSASGEKELFLEGTEPEKDCREADCPKVEIFQWPWHWFR